MKISSLLLLILSITNTTYSQPQKTIYLWSQKVPGQSEPKASPVFSNNKKGSTTRIAKVTNPSLTIYEPDPKLKNGAAVIICPGGGYQILAIDKEGYEVAEWLSKLGYTAFVLQYRVPQKKTGALQDAQRAIRYVRGMSEKWGIETNKIGILGFSAGGSLSARVATQYHSVLYEPTDKFDSLSARPDFAILVYPAYLDKGKNHTLTPELKINKNTPPMFICVANDDKYSNSSLVMSSALKINEVPFELHMLAKGGHGFGIRPGNPAAETWPNLCEKWLKLTLFN